MNPLMMDPGALSGLVSGTGGNTMNPLVLMSLIQGGSTLANTVFSGLLSGAGISEERKYGEKIWGEKQKLTKPKQSYYMTPYLAGYDKVLMKAILNNLAERSGGKSGLDIESIMQLMSGASKNQPQPQATGKYAGLAKQYAY